ncbi:MAG: hypothetical protein EXS01_06995 [Phycisphaerales bacterium]|nr:hypothetical protein [Phycisphaerales bacterium]
MSDLAESDPFALDEFSETGSNSDGVADGMAVHGILALLHPDERARIQARVDRAMWAVRRMGDSRKLLWRRRIAWIGGSAGIAAAVLFAVLYVPADSDSSAYAALESIRGSAQIGGRTYAVRIEMDGHQFSPRGAGSREKPNPDTDGPITQRPDGKPRELPKQPLKGGELAIGEGGRWAFTTMVPVNLRRPLDESIDGSDRRPGRSRGAFGFDGTDYWAVGPDGAIRKADSLRELRVPMFFSALDGDTQSAPQPSSQTVGEDADDDLELLTLPSILAMLDRQYAVAIDLDGMRANSDGRKVTIVTAIRNGLGDPRGPQTVRIVADSTTFEVLRANWEWTEPASSPPHQASPPKARLKRVNIELLDTPSRPSAWFEPSSHGAPQPRAPLE